MKHPLIITSAGKIGLRDKLLASKYANISQALTTASGKAALAAAMIAPIRRSLNYQGIARRTFLVTQLPDSLSKVPVSELQKYRHDAIKINSRGKLFKKGDRFKQLVFPTFQIYASPTIRIADVKRRRFDLIDRTVQKARQEIMAQEDTDIFKALDSISLVESSNKEE